MQSQHVLLPVGVFFPNDYPGTLELLGGMVTDAMQGCTVGSEQNGDALLSGRFLPIAAPLRNSGGSTGWAKGLDLCIAYIQK